MQCRDTGQTFADDRHGHPGLQPTVDFSGRHDAIVNALPAPFSDGIVNKVQSVPPQDVQQVKSVNPFHLCVVDSGLIDERVHIDQMIVLNPRHPGRDLGLPQHLLVVQLCTAEPLG